jgi:hypothetical protein
MLHLTGTHTNLDLLVVVNLYCLKHWLLEVSLIDGESFNFRFYRLEFNKVEHVK